jgi:hypothetical protein
MNAGLMFGRGERRYEVALVGVRGDLGVEQPDERGESPVPWPS